MDKYEKLYNEALERAKEELAACGSMDCDAARQIFRLFPQLRESEDERIRKEMIEFIQWSEDRGTTRHDFHQAKRPAEWIAWLEKQKDASKAIEAVDRIDKYIDEHLANAHDMKNSNPEKKYYRGWDDALGKMAGILQDVYSNEKQKEQKPRKFKLGDKVHWHDDDTNVITITGFRDDAYLTDSAYGPILFCDEDNWERVEQEPAEWSEEDEDMLNSCISSIEEAKETRYAYRETDGDTSYDHEIAWLKSLRPYKK